MFMVKIKQLLPTLLLFMQYVPSWERKKLPTKVLRELYYAKTLFTINYSQPQDTNWSSP